jgi:hypothetical protein
VKINNQNRKSNPQDPLNPEQTHNPGTLIQCQSVDFSYPNTGFKLVTLLTALALGLIAKPYLAHAEENAVTSNLQAVAKSYAQESSTVLAQDHWTRFEFSGTYIDPIVVVEGSSANENNTFIVGVRNVDAMGFEIRLKNCNNSTGNSVQEDVNYAVIEKDQLPATEGVNAEIRQQFSWGECTTAVANTTPTS